MGGAAPRLTGIVGPVSGTVHVVGAGIAGLSAATRLAQAGVTVSLLDGAPMAGGRCRSFHDPVLDRTVDNGTHVLLGANTAALDYVRRIGARDRLRRHPARYPFFDAASGRRWTIDLDRALPAFARIPGVGLATRLNALWRLMPLALRSGQRPTLGALMGEDHPLLVNLLAPFATAALNTEPGEADARLALATLARCLMHGRRGFALYTVEHSLDDAFVAPALSMLADLGARVDFGRRVDTLDAGGDRVRALTVDGARISISPGDAVILATPPKATAALLPGLDVPKRSSAIVNAHYRLRPDAAASSANGYVAVVGGTAQWVFRRGDLVSVTVSAADELARKPADAVAARLWSDVVSALDLPTTTPMPRRHRVIKERRATIAHDGDNLRARPGPHTRLSNLWLAGDWTDTGLPATIEGAVRSGDAAARLALAHIRAASGRETR